MSLRDRVIVPPLSDERWAKIERRIAAGGVPARGARRGVSGMALAFAAVAAVAIVLVGLSRGGDRLVALPALPVAVTAGVEGSRIDVGDASLALGPGAEVRVERAADRVAIWLATGAVAFEVAPRGDRPAFVVRAADVTVTVVGTAFTVERTDRVRVAVAHGRVRVEHGRQVRFLGAGEAWASEREAWASEPEARTAASGAATSGAAAGDADAAVVAAKVSATRTGREPDGEASAPSRPAVGDDGAGSRAPARRGASDRRGATAATAGGGLSAELAAQPLAPILPLDVDAPAEMIRRYAEIVAGRDSGRAAHALYSMAWVHHVRLGQAERAVQILEAYDRRFPRGREADSVGWLRLRILCAAAPGASAACRAAAYTFVARFPGDPRAPVAERIASGRP